MLNTGGCEPSDVPLRPPHTGGEPLVRPARGPVFVPSGDRSHESRGAKGRGRSWKGQRLHDQSHPSRSRLPASSWPRRSCSPPAAAPAPPPRARRRRRPAAAQAVEQANSTGLSGSSTRGPQRLEPFPDMGLKTHNFHNLRPVPGTTFQEKLIFG